MKRGFAGGVSSRALAVVMLVLCSSFAFASPAECPQRSARLMIVDNADWTSGAIASSDAGATIRVSDCGGFAQFTRTLPADGYAAVDNLAANLCSPGAVVRVVELPVLSGCATLATEAVYRDALGNFNVVTIPELGAPLSENSAPATFKTVRSTAPRSTFIAFVSNSSTRALVEVYDETGALVFEDMPSIEGFLFYELPAAVTIGRVTVTNIGPGVGPLPPSELYAVAFSGFREGGSPRVIVAE